jgi:23S rRNA pseudouridine1911/1915/1917 synthase
MKNDESECIIIREEEKGERLDKILSQRFLGVHSRTYFQYLIEQGRIFVNGEVVKKRYRPLVDDEISIHYILTPEIGLQPEAIPLNIIFEDNDLIVVNKPAGMVVHPAPGHPTGTFVHALIYHCQNLPKNQVEELYPRPGIVHRLDKDTSGLLVAAKTTEAHTRLIEMFSNREVHKEYLAICVGNPGSQEIRNFIGRHPIFRQKMKVLEEGGRLAISVCETKNHSAPFSLVQVNLKTGRTHQIRVHMQHLGAPILGDPLYGNLQINKKYGVSRQLLHAHILQFKHPVKGHLLSFKADIPSDMRVWVEKLIKHAGEEKKATISS